MTNEQRIELFENVPVKKAVFQQTVPAVASQLVTLVYNLTDTFFVGMLNSPAETAAVTTGSSTFFFLTVFANLFGVGAASAISRALGRKEPEKCRVFASASFWMSLIVTGVYILFLTAFIQPILSLCGATGPVYPHGEAYVFWLVVIGGIPAVINMMLAHLIRSEGSAVIASTGVSLGALLNILLDPFFILPQFLGMRAAGAGLASAFGNIFASLFFLVYLLRRKNGVLSLSPVYLKKAKTVLPEILSVGFPSAVQTGLTVVSVTALAKFTSAYGPAAVAGYGIIKKLNQLPVFVVIGISNGLMPMLAYNYASGNDSRRKSIFRFGVTASVVFAVICMVVYELFAPQLAWIFIRDRETISYAAAFLRRIVIAEPLMAFCYPMLIHMQAMKEVRAALICSIIRKGALDIPLLFLMDSLIPLYGCMWVQPIVDTISLITEVIFYRRICRRQQAQE